MTCGTRNGGHWAAGFLLAGYRRGAAGPDAYDCWGLVRAAVRVRHGVDLPAVQAENDHLVAAAVMASRRAGWRPIDEAPADGDIVLMRNAFGLRHVGLMVGDGAALRLLHCEHGGPRWQAIAELPQLGYRDLQPWRLA